MYLHVSSRVDPTKAMCGFHLASNVRIKQGFRFPNPLLPWVDIPHPTSPNDLSSLLSPPINFVPTFFFDE